MLLKRTYIIFLLSLLSMQLQAQEKDSFTIDFGALVLADQPDIFSEEYNFVYTGSYPLTPLNFDTSVGSFWEPVDMSAAIDKSNQQQKRAMELRPIRVKSYGFTVQSPYADDGQSKVRNIAYKDMRGLQFLSPCPPVGICWRCAPYRSSRIFR